jgi:hypothetical protein
MKAIILSFMTALAVVSTFAVSAQSAPGQGATFRFTLPDKGLA